MDKDETTKPRCCPHCRSSDTIYDEDTKEEVCKNCGFKSPPEKFDVGNKGELEW